MRRGEGGLASTGVAGLDEILGGGLPRKRLYLVHGATGTGKTTLGLQFVLEAARRDEPALYVSLGETPEELRSIAEARGWTLEDIDLYSPSPDPDVPGEHYTFFHVAEVEMDETWKSLAREIETSGASRVVVDTISELRLISGDPLAYRRKISFLRDLCSRRDCTVLLLDDEPHSDDQALWSLSHGILRLEQRFQDYGPSRRRMCVVKLRGQPYSDGYHDLRIEPGGVVVYPRLVATRQEPTVQEPTASEEMVSTGVAELDELLGGGPARGTSTLLVGPPGSGKSSLAMQMAVAATQRGERAKIFLFDENRDIYLSRWRSLGGDGIDGAPLDIHQVDAAEMPPGQFARCAIDAVERGCRLLVIDSLNGYLHAMPAERFLELHVHELLAYLSRHGIVTILVMAQRGIIGDSVVSPADLSYLADSVVLLRFFEVAGKMRRAVSAIKKRTGPHERTIRELELSSDGIHVGEPLRDYRGIFTGSPIYTAEMGDIPRQEH